MVCTHTAEGYSRESSVLDSVLIPAKHIGHAHHSEGYREGPMLTASYLHHVLLIPRSCRSYGLGQQVSVTMHNCSICISVSNMHKYDMHKYA